MRKILLLVLCSCISYNVYAQEPSIPTGKINTELLLFTLQEIEPMFCSNEISYESLKIAIMQLTQLYYALLRDSQTNPLTVEQLQDLEKINAILFQMQNCFLELSKIYSQVKKKAQK